MFGGVPYGRQGNNGVDVAAFPTAGARALLFRALIACLITTAAMPTLAQVSASACGPIETGGYGPYDYRTDRNKLPIVEGAHFTPEVEALIRGKSTYLGADLNYTLRRFPNHHRALIAVARYGEKAKSPQPHDLPLPVECYFDLAVRFRPDDAIVRMLYAKFLVTNRRTPEAGRQLAAAISIAADNPFSHYNIGLIYFDMKDYAHALAQAHVASELGFNVSPLREQLRAAGQWTDPVAAPASAAQSGEKPASAP